MTQFTASRLVGRRIKELRRRRELSAFDLAVRCAAAGAPDLNRSVLANMESGRRLSVSIDEVLVLAYVLNVPPVLLFTPVGTTDRVTVSSDVSLGPGEALDWVCGDMPISDNGAWQESAHLVELTRRFARFGREGGSMTELADLLADMSRASVPIPEELSCLLKGQEG